MKTHARRAAWRLAAIAPLALLTAAATYTVPIATDTPVTAHLTDSLSSTSASAGETFQIVAADPLVLQGWPVIQKGALGQGHVVSTTSVKAKDGASVSVQFDWITAVSGQQIPLHATKGKIDPLVFGAKGPLAANFPKGKEVNVGSDLVFTTYVSADRVVTITTGS